MQQIKKAVDDINNGTSVKKAAEMNKVNTRTLNNYYRRYKKIVNSGTFADAEKQLFNGDNVTEELLQSDISLQNLNTDF